MVGLILIGPTRLPQMIRTAGILRKRVLSMINSARWELEQELNTEDLKRLRRDGWLEGDPIPALKEDPASSKKSTDALAEDPTPASKKGAKSDKTSSGSIEGDPIPALKEDPASSKKSTGTIAEDPTPSPEKEAKSDKPSKAKKAAPKRNASARASKKSPS